MFILILTLFLIILLRTLSRLIIERNPFLLLVGLGLLTIVQAQALNWGGCPLASTKGMTLPRKLWRIFNGCNGDINGLLLNVTSVEPAETIVSWVVPNE